MSKSFTQESINRIKFRGQEERYTVSGCRGLSFVVRGDGKFWHWRMTRKGIRYHEHIGAVTDITLSDAKTIALAYRNNVMNGFQPQYKRIKNCDITLQQAYDEYISSADFNLRKPDYKQNFKYRMEKYVVGDTNGDIGNIKLSSIILSNIDEPIARQHWASVKSFSNPNVAKTVKSHCKVVIDWATQNLGIQLPFNPFSFSAPNVVVQRREEIFSELQMKSLIEAFQSEDKPIRHWLNCVLLTGFRNGELAQIRWSELEHSITVPETNESISIWNAPPKTMKSNSQTRLLLSNLVMKQINELYSRDNIFVFTYGNMNKGGEEIYMTPPTKQVRSIMNKLNIPSTLSLHSIRHTLVTRLKEFGVPAANIDKFLGKSVREGASSHSTYAHSDSLTSKLAVVNRWEEYLISLGYKAL